VAVTSAAADPGSAGRSFLEAHRREFTAQLQRVLLARVVVVLACLAIVLIYEEGTPRLLASAHVTLVLAAGVSIAHLIAFRRLPRYDRLIVPGLVADFLFAAALCYLTGGILNAGSTVLFFATILEAALLVSDRAGYVVASAATVALAAIAVAYWLANQQGLALPAVPEPLYAGVPLRWGRVTGNLIAVLVAYNGVAVLAARLPYRVSSVRILYDEVIERLREGLVAIDKAGGIVLVNPEACRLLNWSHPGSLVGRRYEEVLRRREDRAVLEVLARGIDVQTALTLQIRGRGAVEVEVTTTVIGDGRGGVRGVVGIFRDLSLARRLEEAERRVARLAGTEEVAMGIAHEIRTPLASIRGAVQELTSRSLDDPLDRRLSDIVRRESDRLDRLLQGFLDYARMRPPLSAPIDVAQLALETAELLRRRPDAAKVEIECPRAGPFVVRADGDQLRQTFMNIGTNALEAIGGGAGRLVVSMREVELPRRTEGPERRVESRRGVEVAFDNDGPPLDPKDAERIFAPFFTTKAGGHGLGLAITQKVVRLHGGVMTCDGGALGGVCFRVQLPLDLGSAARAEA
jgi:two-component system sensor histidine kinase PilS (NtrC family)